MAEEQSQWVVGERVRISQGVGKVSWVHFIDRIGIEGDGWQAAFSPSNGGVERLDWHRFRRPESEPGFVDPETGWVCTGCGMWDHPGQNVDAWWGDEDGGAHVSTAEVLRPPADDPTAPQTLHAAVSMLVRDHGVPAAGAMAAGAEVDEAPACPVPAPAGCRPATEVAGEGAVWRWCSNPSYGGWWAMYDEEGSVLALMDSSGKANFYGNLKRAEDINRDVWRAAFSPGPAGETPEAIRRGWTAPAWLVEELDGRAHFGENVPDPLTTEAPTAQRDEDHVGTILGCDAGESEADAARRVVAELDRMRTEVDAMTRSADRLREERDAARAELDQLRQERRPLTAEDHASALVELIGSEPVKEDDCECPDVARALYYAADAFLDELRPARRLDRIAKLTTNSVPGDRVEVDDAE